MEGSTVLAASVAVRIRPLGGGGNETQVEAPASGVFSVHGLEPGNYEAVDDHGNTRVFTVGSASDEIVLEDYGDGPDVPAGVALDPLHPIEAPLVPDESHEIQAGVAAMQVDGATLSRPALEGEADVAPPTVPGPDNAAVEGVVPSAVVTEETVGNSSDASWVTPEDAIAPVADAPAAGDGVPGDAGLDVPPVGATDAAPEGSVSAPVPAGSDVPPADDPEHEPEHPVVDPGAQA